MYFLHAEQLLADVAARADVRPEFQFAADRPVTPEEHAAMIAGAANAAPRTALAIQIDNEFVMTLRASGKGAFQVIRPSGGTVEPYPIPLARAFVLIISQINDAPGEH